MKSIRFVQDSLSFHAIDQKEKLQRFAQFSAAFAA
jgi:hypothetical protein